MAAPALTYEAMSNPVPPSSESASAPPIRTSSPSPPLSPFAPPSPVSVSPNDEPARFSTALSVSLPAPPVSFHQVLVGGAPREAG